VFSSCVVALRGLQSTRVLLLLPSAAQPPLPLQLLLKVNLHSLIWEQQGRSPLPQLQAMHAGESTNTASPPPTCGRPARSPSHAQGRHPDRLWGACGTFGNPLPHPHTTV